MSIADGYTELPQDRLGAIVTYLEMTAPPAGWDAPLPPPPGYGIRAVARPELAWYRDLFRRVGLPWLWFSRLRFNDEELAAKIHNPAVSIFALTYEGQDVGLLELDRDEFPEIELTFFGIVPEHVGKGAGRFLIQHGVQVAFRQSPSRFKLHTCTLDHPAALPFYLKAGFRAYKRAVEVFPDPRLTGLCPRNAAPQVPLIE